MLRPGSDAYFLHLAYEQACIARDLDEVPVGAVLVDDEGKVLGKAYNQIESCHDVTGHAELLVLRKVMADTQSRRLLGCTLYSTLEPCLMCAGAIIHSRVKRLVYGAKDPKTGAAGSVLNVFEIPFNHRVQVGFHFQANCAQILTDFFVQKRAISRQIKKKIDGL